MLDFDNALEEGLFSCDFCKGASTMEQYYGSFSEVVAEAKKKGWKIFKDASGEWMHKCPDCVKGPSAQEDF